MSSIITTIPDSIIRNLAPKWPDRINRQDICGGDIDADVQFSFVDENTPKKETISASPDITSYADSLESDRPIMEWLVSQSSNKAITVVRWWDRDHAIGIDVLHDGKLSQLEVLSDLLRLAEDRWAEEYEAPSFADKMASTKFQEELNTEYDGDLDYAESEAVEQVWEYRWEVRDSLFMAFIEACQAGDLSLEDHPLFEAVIGAEGSYEIIPDEAAEGNVQDNKIDER